MSDETKNKLKKVGIFSYLGITTLLSILFIVLCVVAGVNNGKKNKSNNSVPTNTNEIVEVQHRNKLNPKYASYDDSLHTIELSVDDLDDFTFENLFTYLSTVSNADQPNIVCDGTYSFNNKNNYSIAFKNTTNDYVLFLVGDYSDFNDQTGGSADRDYEFYSTDDDMGVVAYSSMIIYCSSSNYSDIKFAIQLDLGESSGGDINSNIFTTLTSSVVSFIGSLSSGIVAMESVFYANGDLTTIGLLSVIVVAISLAYFLFRLLIGLIRMRG